MRTSLGTFVIAFVRRLVSVYLRPIKAARDGGKKKEEQPHHKGTLQWLSMVVVIPLWVVQSAEATTPNEGEVLYNGIRLPKQWPPIHDAEAKSRQAQPVPYLDAPPEVIPIDVGRQLFVDDYLISQSTLKRVFHHAIKYPGNPILKPETPLEIHGKYSKKEGDDPTATACPFDDGVFFDPRDRLFKLWYMAGFWANTCLATSEDGLHWTRPIFDVTAGTNVVIPFRAGFYRDSFSPWPDWNETDPAQRWKAFIFARVAKEPQAKPSNISYLWTSPDGIHWQPKAKVKERVGDSTTIFYNPFRGKWAMSIRRSIKERGRARYYFEADSFAGLAKMKSEDEVF